MYIVHLEYFQENKQTCTGWKHAKHLHQLVPPAIFADQLVVCPEQLDQFEDTVH